MPTLLTLETTCRDDGKAVLIAAGEIDLSNIGTFTRALTAAITETDGSGAKLTVDLGAVEYLDSAAINALFTHAEHIQLIVRPLMMRIFEITGLTELTAIEPASSQAEH
jgi:anti-anti-sigma factor